MATVVYVGTEENNSLIDYTVSDRVTFDVCVGKDTYINSVVSYFNSEKYRDLENILNIIFTKGFGLALFKYFGTDISTKLLQFTNEEIIDVLNQIDSFEHYYTLTFWRSLFKNLDKGLLEVLLYKARGCLNDRLRDDDSWDIIADNGLIDYVLGISTEKLYLDAKYITEENKLLVNYNKDNLVGVDTSLKDREFYNYLFSLNCNFIEDIPLEYITNEMILEAFRLCDKHFMSRQLDRFSYEQLSKVPRKYFISHGDKKKQSKLGIYKSFPSQGIYQNTNLLVKLKDIKDNKRDIKNLTDITKDIVELWVKDRFNYFDLIGITYKLESDSIELKMLYKDTVYRFELSDDIKDLDDFNNIYYDYVRDRQGWYKLFLLDNGVLNKFRGLENVKNYLDIII